MDKEHVKTEQDEKNNESQSQNKGNNFSDRIEPKADEGYNSTKF
jgi:hypothetical protein